MRDKLDLALGTELASQYTKRTKWCKRSLYCRIIRYKWQIVHVNGFNYLSRLRWCEPFVETEFYRESLSQGIKSEIHKHRVRKNQIQQQKTQNVNICNSTFGFILKRVKSRNSKRYTHVPSIVNNSQGMKATPEFINEWTDKQNVVCTGNRIFSALKRDANSLYYTHSIIQRTFEVLSLQWKWIAFTY